MDLGTNWLCQSASAFDGALNHLKSVHQLPAGSPIFERGRPADRIVFVEAGLVLTQFSTKPSSAPRLVTKGAVLGLNEALTGSEYKVTAQAHSDVRLSCIPRGVLLEFLSKNPEVCMKLVRSLSEDLRELYRKMGSFRVRTRRRRKP